MSSKQDIKEKGRILARIVEIRNKEINLERREKIKTKEGGEN